MAPWEWAGGLDGLRIRPGVRENREAVFGDLTGPTGEKAHQGFQPQGNLILSTAFLGKLSSSHELPGNRAKMLNFPLTLSFQDLAFDKVQISVLS